MPRFDIVKRSEVSNTYRTSAIMGAFDIDASHLQEHFAGNIDIEGKEWSIGLIVGNSGTGKTSIARECFPDAYVVAYDYTHESVVDDMPKASIKDIQRAFTSVGFSSPPSWLKPYSVLSNGEKMRVDLARAILSDSHLIVYDEFTSVVNRDVAKVTSYAIQKAIRKGNKQFIAVSCHDDVIEWLSPDWIFDTNSMSFFGQRGNSTAPASNCQFTGLISNSVKVCGTYLESIII